MYNFFEKSKCYVRFRIYSLPYFPPLPSVLAPIPAPVLCPFLLLSLSLEFEKLDRRKLFCHPRLSSSVISPVLGHVVDAH